MPCLGLALVSGLLLAAGARFGQPVSPDPHTMLRAACLQLGSLGLIVGILPLPLLWLPGARRRAILAKVRTFLATVVLSLVFLFGAGELALRWIYRDGMSFASHAGPLVRRFERDFRFNRFDGPSRGPEVAGPKAPGELRILFEGDSITWGQGVKDEDLLYTNRLLAELRAANPAFAAATLAWPGRELDAHLAQLQKWGAEIDPDLIVYQWYINDIELDPRARNPQRKRLWRSLFFHRPLLHRSYLWFLLDFRLDLMLPSQASSYEDHIIRQYAPGTAGWAEFTALFRAWAAAARRLTPRIVVMLFPRLVDEVQFVDFHRRLVELCRQEGIVALDLIPWLAEFGDDYAQTFATPFDAHPNARVHAHMAEALHHTIEEAWPELLRTQGAPAGAAR